MDVSAAVAGSTSPLRRLLLQSDTTPDTTTTTPTTPTTPTTTTTTRSTHATTEHNKPHADDTAAAEGQQVEGEEAAAAAEEAEAEAQAPEPVAPLLAPTGDDAEQLADDDTTDTAAHAGADSKAAQPVAGETAEAAEAAEDEQAGSVDKDKKEEPTEGPQAQPGDAGEDEQDSPATASPDKTTATSGSRGSRSGKRGSDPAAVTQASRKKSSSSGEQTVSPSRTSSDSVRSSTPTETADSAVNTSDEQLQPDAEVADSAKGSSRRSEQQEAGETTSEAGQATADEAEAADGEVETGDGEAQQVDKSDALAVEANGETDTTAYKSKAKKEQTIAENVPPTAGSAERVCPPSSVQLTSAADVGLVVSLTAASTTVDCAAPSSYVVEYSAFPHFPLAYTASVRLDGSATSATLPPTHITPSVRYYVRVIASAVPADEAAEDAGAVAGRRHNIDESQQQPYTVSDPPALALTAAVDADVETATTAATTTASDSAAISTCEAVVTASMPPSEAAHTSLSLTSLRSQLMRLLHVKAATESGQKRIKAISVRHNDDEQRDEAIITISAPYQPEDDNEGRATAADEEEAEEILLAVQSSDKSALYSQPAWLIAELLKFNVTLLDKGAHQTAAQIETVEAVRLNCSAGRTAGQHTQPHTADERTVDATQINSEAAEHNAPGGALTMDTSLNTPAEPVDTADNQQQVGQTDVPPAEADPTPASTDSTEKTAVTDTSAADTVDAAAADADTATEADGDTTAVTDPDTVTDAAADTTEPTNNAADAPADEAQRQPAHAHSDNTQGEQHEAATQHADTPSTPTTDTDADAAGTNQSPVATPSTADVTTPIQQPQDGDNQQVSDQQAQPRDEPRDTPRDTETESAEAASPPRDEADSEPVDTAGEVRDDDAVGGSSTPEDRAARREVSRSSTLLGFLFSHTLAAALILAACMGSIAYCVFVRSVDNGGFAPLRQSETDLERGMAGGQHSTTSHSTHSHGPHNAHSSSAAVSSAASASSGSSERSMVDLDDEQQYQLALLRHSDTAANGGLHFLEDVLTRLGIPSYGQAAFSQKLRDNYLTTIQQIDALDAADWKRINLPLVIEEAVRQALEDRRAMIQRGGEATFSASTKAKAAPGLSLKHGATALKKHDRDRDDRANGSSSGASGGGGGGGRADADRDRSSDDRKASRPNGSAEKKKPLVSEALDDEHEDDVEGWADDF